MRFNRIVLFTILSAFVLVLVACQGSVYSRMSGKTGLAYASMESCTDIDNTYKSGQWNPESYLLGTYVEQGGIPYPDRCSSNTLYEQYCDGVRREQTVQCPAGYACKTNACTSTSITRVPSIMAHTALPARPMLASDNKTSDKFFSSRNPFSSS